VVAAAVAAAPAAVEAAADMPRLPDASYSAPPLCTAAGALGKHH